MNDKELTPACAAEQIGLRVPVVQPAADADRRTGLRLAGFRWNWPAGRGQMHFVDQIVDVLGLGDRMGHRPSELSGGQQQRVAVRARLRSPRGLTWCTPTSRPATSTPAPALRCSVSSGGECVQLGQTVVLVTHDPIAAAIADRVLFLADGELVDERPGLDDGGECLDRHAGGLQRLVTAVAPQGPAARPQPRDAS